MADYGARFTKIMLHQYRKAIAEDHPHLIPLFDESRIDHWHYLVVGLPAPYRGGEYLIHLAVKESFPQTPPSFEVITENGVFTPGGKICISIGEYHATNTPGKEGSYGWRPVLGMRGFAREVVNGLLTPDTLVSGIRIETGRTTASDRARLARASAAGNRAAHAELMLRADEFAAGHPDAAAVRAMRRWRAARIFCDRPGTSRWSELNALAPDVFGDNWPDVAPAFIQAEETPPGRPAPGLRALVDEAARAYAPAIQKALLVLAAAHLMPEIWSAEMPAAVILAIGEEASRDVVRGLRARLRTHPTCIPGQIGDALQAYLLAESFDARDAAADRFKSSVRLAPEAAKRAARAPKDAPSRAPEAAAERVAPSRAPAPAAAEPKAQAGPAAENSPVTAQTTAGDAPAAEPKAGPAAEDSPITARSAAGDAPAADGIPDADLDQYLQELGL